MTNFYPEIDEVIAYIHNHLDEPLPLSRLAQQAIYSPFHFSRIFKEKTGLSPHYFVSSLKLQRAKDLLLNTGLTVRDISLEINQQSLGTFTTRFTTKVGMSPMQFRKSAIQVKDYMHSLKNHTDWPQERKHGNLTSKVEGTLESLEPLHGVILVGLFTKPIPEGLPQYGTLLSASGDFCFTDVLPGIYYLMAAGVNWEMEVNEILVPHQTLRAKAERPIKVGLGLRTSHQRLLLRKPRLNDPPILISLPLLMKNFLNRV